MVGSKVKRLITLPASTLLFTLPPHGHRSDRFLKETIPHGGWPSFRASQHCGPVCRGETSSRWNLSVSKVASVHGLRYIFEERLPSSDRILWSAAVFLCLLLSGTMVVQVGNSSPDETVQENKSRAEDKNLVLRFTWAGLKVRCWRRSQRQRVTSRSLISPRSPSAVRSFLFPSVLWRLCLGVN